MTLPLEALASLAEDAALAAGGVIRASSRDSLRVEQKQGGDTRASQIVTEVDFQSQAAILQVLDPTIQKHNLGLLTEEREDDRSRLEKPAFWCIDPLDGTLPFTEGTPGYAVSIALVGRDGTPLIGVVLDPCRDVRVVAIRGHGCFSSGARWKQPEPRTMLGHFTDRSTVKQPWYAAARKWLDQEADRGGMDGVHETLDAGAVLNALRVLEKPPSCYFKLPRSTRGGGSLWDYAASACIFSEMGAVACDFTGRPLDLNRPDDTFLNHRGVLFASTPAIADGILGWAGSWVGG